MSVGDTDNVNGNKRPHIVIVGGGMVGISLALMLSQQLNKDNDSGAAPQVDISLIEKFAFPVHKLPSNSPAESTVENLENLLQPSFDARSSALSAGSVELLKKLGVWESLQAQAEAIRDIHISDRGHYGGALLHSQDYGVDALGYVIENRWLGRCLLAQLQQTGVNCIAPATVERCRMTQQGAQLSLAANEDSGSEVSGSEVSTLLADVVLIADGAESALRQSLGIEHSTRPYQQSAIVANIALSKPHNGVAYERFTSQGPLALLPLGDCDGVHRASVVWTRDTHEVEPLLELGDEEWLKQLQACFGYRANHFTHVGERQAYPLALVQANEQVRSHVVVMGNAAHFLHPVAGQGFNLSLRDCQSVVDVLATAQQQGESLGHYTVLKRYEAQREQDQQLTIGLTHSMVKAFSTEQTSVSVLRQLGLLSLHTIPAAKNHLARQMMGVA